MLYTLLMLVSCFSFSNETLAFKYMGYDFTIPENPRMIGSVGGVSNTLLFVYEFKHNDRTYSPNDRSLSIRYMNNDELYQELSDQPNCNNARLLNDVYNNKKDSGCSQENRDIYFDIFLDGKEYGTWPGENANIYYAVDGSRITVTLFIRGKVDLMIQTNNMTKEEVKAILANYIAE
ncbi:MAG: hypothetical protein P8X74_17000 [Reinekea sp.]